MNKYYIRIKNMEQLKAVCNINKEYVLILDSDLCEMNPEAFMKEQGIKCPMVYAFPEVMRENKIRIVEDAYSKLEKAEGIMIKNLDELGFLAEKKYEGIVYADSFLYTYNSEAAGFYMDIFPDIRFVCSDELTDREMSDTIEHIRSVSATSGKTRIEKADRFIYKVYGHQQLMVTNQCLSHNYCSCKEKLLKFRDEKGNDFYAQSRCRHCFSIIYSGKPVNMLDKTEEIPYNNLLIDLTVENEKQSMEILNEIFGNPESKKENENPGKGKNESRNRGHHYRGVD